jgi:hypothetical protein
MACVVSLTVPVADGFVKLNAVIVFAEEMPVPWEVVKPVLSLLLLHPTARTRAITAALNNVDEDFMECPPPRISVDILRSDLSRKLRRAHNFVY